MDESKLPGEIDVQLLSRWRAEGRTLLLLDVREDWEREICRFDDALEIPLAQLPQRVGELPRDVPVVVLCHHGGRSARAVGWLQQAGVTNAINLDGGIDAWARIVDPSMGVY